MSLFEHARNIVCSIIAVALAMTVATVEALLPRRPDWLERINQLALQLKYISGGEDPGSKKKRAASASGKSDKNKTSREPEMDAEQLLRAYNQLWQFAHAVRTDGLSLDDKFCERVEREWNVKKLLSFMRSADRSLQDRAENSLEAAAAYLAAATANDNHPS